MSRNAPGPKGRLLSGSMNELRRDVLGLMQRSVAAHGDVVRFRMGPMTVHVINHPDAIKRVLVDPHTYDKQTRASKMISRLTGESLLVSNGATWDRQRRLLMPAFAPMTLKPFFAIMSDATDELIAQFEPLAARGGEIDIASRMMALTYRIVEKALFGTDPENIDALEPAISTILADIYKRIENPFVMPRAVPTRKNRAYDEAMALLDGRVQHLIDSHRDRPGDDVLHRLMRESDFSDTELRNETITLLIAGHETTANALTWFWHLLGQHPEAEDALMAELPAGELQADDMVGLSLTQRALDEAMRLYPPIWAIVRRVCGDQELGGFDVPGESRVIISPWVVHRHKDFWDTPDRFDPDRERPAHPYAYIPFGGGPRLCIGHGFAKMEARIIAAKLLQRFRFEPMSDSAVIPQPGITLRPRGGLAVRIHLRG